MDVCSLCVGPGPLLQFSKTKQCPSTVLAVPTMPSWYEHDMKTTYTKAPQIRKVYLREMGLIMKTDINTSS